jgi:hypothetical protein
MDCTLCLECVKACPSDNIGILARTPVPGLVLDPMRSSLGRFSRRQDIAVLVLVIVFSAFVNAAGMVAPVTEWRDRISQHLSMVSILAFTGVSMFIALIVTPVLLLGLATIAGQRLSRIHQPIREIFCRFSLALLPLGVTMWCAHVLFHFSTAWGAAWPAVQQAAGALGIVWLGAPRWTVTSPLLATDTILVMQVLLLDAGVLLSLYLGWRIAQTYTSEVWDVLRLFTPWATLATALFVAGIWVFQEPMQMRGMLHG